MKIWLFLMFFSAFTISCGGDSTSTTPEECADGFIRSGSECVDVDECSAPGLCANGVCTNQPGTYECVCSEGFERQGEGCVAVETNPCQPNPCGSGTCTAGTDVAFMCACPNGEAFDGQTCVVDVGVDECANGTATCSEFAACFNTVDGFSCMCGTGYEGDGTTCTDADGCANSPCFEGVSCTDVAAPGNGFTCGACPTDYEGDGVTCTPQDACQPDSCFPGVTCTTTAPGLIECGECPVGYAGDGVECIEVDPCNVDPCFAGVTCTATGPGTFACGTCPEGYSGNGITCSDINECAQNPCDANATCINTVGDFTCICDSGYVGDGFFCNLPSSCDPATPGTCSPLASCSDDLQPGVFACLCLNGYEGNGESCTNINECSRGTFTCRANSTCVDTPGAYQCACLPGFTDVNGVCVDIDGCANDPCFDGVSCTDVPAPGTGYSCGNCPAGLTGDGVSCSDIDECLQNPCDANATCTNTTGSFTCTCADGYVGDGVTCFVPSTCDPTNPVACDANATCQDSNGDDVFGCECDAGYEGDGTTCTDINECNRNTDNCAANAICTNNDGGFTCACGPGLTGDGITCSDTNGCSNDPCFDGVTCTDVPAPGNGFTCGLCPTGTQGNGIVCLDINGCANDPCADGVACTDVPAPGTGFTCGTCPPGTEGNGITCVDIDGCANDPCFGSVTCTDVPAPGTGFSCGTCPMGYTGDGINCVADNAVCNPNPCYTGVVCTPDGQNSYTCASCPAGMAGDGITCRYQILVDLTPGGSAIATGTPGNGIFDPGSLVTLTATPAVGYDFVEWQIGGTQVSTVNPLQFQASATVTYLAVFAPTQYTVTIPASPNGAATGAGSYSYNERVYVTATPNPNYLFDYWTDEDGNVTTDASFNFQITENRTFTPTFKPKPSYSVTLSKTPEDGGTVSQPGGPYFVQSSVTVTATPAAGYRFKGWYDANTHTLYSFNEQYTFTITQDRALRAEFVLQHTLTTSKRIKRNTNYVTTPNGTVTAGGLFDAGQDVQLTATAPLGWKFWAWVDENNTFISNLNPITVDIQSDLHYRAVFVDQTQYVATTGNDTTGRGTQTLPWRTPQAAVQFLADHGARNGSEVRLQAGTYDVNTNTEIQVTGGLRLLGGYAADWTRQYRTFANRNNATYKTEIRNLRTTPYPNSLPVATVNVSGLGSVLEGVTLTSDNTLPLSQPLAVSGESEARYNNVRVATRSGSHGIGVSSGARVHNNVIDAPTEGTASFQPYGDVEIFNNTVYGGRLYHSDTCTSASCLTQTMQIYDNDFLVHPTTQTAATMSITGGNLALSRNVIQGYVDVIALNGTIHVIEGNTITGTTGRDVFGLRQQGLAVIRNNTIFGGFTNEIGGSASGVILVSNAQEIEFHNNTVDSGRIAGPDGARKICAVQMGDNTKLINNIIYSGTDVAKQGTLSSTNYVRGICTSSFTNLTVQHNLFWPDLLTFIYPAAAPFTVIAYNGTNNYAGNVSFSPMLVNSAPESNGGNWRLSNASPDAAKFGGLNLSAEFTDDKIGVTRTTGGPAPGNGGAGWSIGAYEFVP